MNSSGRLGRMEEVPRECAEQGVPDSVDLWPKIEESVEATVRPDPEPKFFRGGESS